MIADDGRNYECKNRVCRKCRTKQLCCSQGQSHQTKCLFALKSLWANQQKPGSGEEERNERGSSVVSIARSEQTSESVKTKFKIWGGSKITLHTSPPQFVSSFNCDLIKNKITVIRDHRPAIKREGKDSDVGENHFCAIDDKRDSIRI